VKPPQKPQDCLNTVLAFSFLDATNAGTSLRRTERKRKRKVPAFLAMKTTRASRPRCSQARALAIFRVGAAELLSGGRLVEVMRIGISQFHLVWFIWATVTSRGLRVFRMRDTMAPTLSPLRLRAAIETFSDFEPSTGRAFTPLLPHPYRPPNINMPVPHDFEPNVHTGEAVDQRGLSSFTDSSRPCQKHLDNKNSLSGPTV